VVLSGYKSFKVENFEYKNYIKIIIKKKSKQFEFVSEQLSKIGKEVTSVLFSEITWSYSR
jgi:hypothetical protein